ncbi:MAG: HlyD family efflux transporter periplasmic adaptor subunit [Oscillospiraceae bacterium]|nr:HlyD family efflux transporter periplasmic adaptor subunit [Oscillospiraceae bacterium]
MEAVKPKKSRKKLWIGLTVTVVVIAVLFGACSIFVSSAKKKMEAAMNAMQTDVVSVRSLTRSIGATGKVISAERKDVTTTLTNVEIADIPVEVGDTVEEGQVIVQFDTEDIAEDLARAQRALGQTQGQYGISAQNAQRQVEDALRGADYQAEAAYSQMKSAYDAYVGAIEDLEDLEEAEEDAYRAWKDEKEILRGLEDEDPTIEAQSAATEAAKAAYEQATAARETMEDSIDKLYDSYVMAISTYENTVASGESTVASAQAAQQSTALSVNTDQQQKQVDALSEQLEKGSLTAPISGIVTAVNYEKGDTYLQGAILTIQDCSSFEIEAQIGEYDIPDIQKGQKVLIKTDATREQELEGTVVFVAPTATAVAASMTGMTTASTDPTYEVRISVDTPTDRLRLDMSASLSIIIRQEADALTVPYNAVQTDENGNTFVEAVNDDETTTIVPVEVLMESSYYTQIAGDLQEGQTIRIISREATDIFSEMMEMSAMGQGG